VPASIPLLPKEGFFIAIIPYKISDLTYGIYRLMASEYKPQAL
jgi:hypothetical protein